MTTPPAASISTPPTTRIATTAPTRFQKLTDCITTGGPVFGKIALSVALVAAGVFASSPFLIAVGASVSLYTAFTISQQVRELSTRTTEQLVVKPAETNPTPSTTETASQESSLPSPEEYIKTLNATIQTLVASGKESNHKSVMASKRALEIAQGEVTYLQDFLVTIRAIIEQQMTTFSKENKKEKHHDPVIQLWKATWSKIKEIGQARIAERNLALDQAFGSGASPGSRQAVKLTMREPSQARARSQSPASLEDLETSRILQKGILPGTETRPRSHSTTPITLSPLDETAAHIPKK